MRQSIGKYLEVEDIGAIQNASGWHIYNTRNVYLGSVSWYRTWRQFVFAPASNTEYSAGCLDDISKFIKEKNRARREPVDHRDGDLDKFFGCAPGLTGGNTAREYIENVRGEEREGA